MSGPTTQIAGTRSRALDQSLQIAVIVGASFFVAFCARISLPIPGTPVPLTLQNFGVLLVGLALGSRIGFAALALAGMPVFSPFSAAGVLRFIGPSGGYLIAYPFVAAFAG